jgi:predicted acetyltransferase
MPRQEPVLELVEPSRKWKPAFLAMASDWREHDADRYGRALDDFEGYLAANARYLHPDGPPPGCVPGTELWLVESRARIVACVRLRFRLNAALEVEGGHVGYDVPPSMRRRGYGTAALRSVLPEARRRGLQRLLLTVDSDNVASIKVIENNGGVLSGEAMSPISGKPIRRYWLDL